MPVAEATTVRIHRETHKRLTGAKPYDSMSYEEFLIELLDEYENQEEHN